MSSRGGEMMRQWFINGEGIDRHVISADIQRYLGNDATVRPGVGSGEFQGVQGYWIKAYRNLTSAMISDLRADSARWRQERATGTRGDYVGSSTYHSSAAGRQDRRGGDSPLVDSYAGRERERVPPSTSRLPQDRMDIDMLPGAPTDRRYGQPDRGYLPPDSRGYPPDSRPPYSQEPPAYSGFGRPPVSSYPSQEPRYAPSGSYAQASDGTPAGYVRPGNQYLPVSTYETASAMPSRSEAPGYGAYSQPTQVPSRGDGRGDPRYPTTQQDYDPRYAYPSPATTVSTAISARDRERDQIASLQQPSGFPQTTQAQYDQYGRRKYH